MTQQQRGGTILGFILGMVVGLGVALAVAVYVTKVPVPFLSKEGSLKEYESSEAERNRNWDPNSPLYGKNPAPAAPVSGSASGVLQPAPTAPVFAPQPPVVDVPVAPEVALPSTQPEPPVIKPAPAPVVTPAPATASADPLGDLANAKLKAAESKAATAAPAASSAEGFSYFVQAGAFRNQAEADAQRAKLAMMGWEARVSEREQNGRAVFRVRVGPFNKRGDAEQLKQKLDGAGVDTALVRVQQ